jgi:hypothetical protein
MVSMTIFGLWISTKALIFNKAMNFYEEMKERASQMTSLMSGGKNRVIFINPRTTSEYCIRIPFVHATTVANNCMVISF